MKIFIISILALSSLFFGNSNSHESILSTNENPGEEVFNDNCASCHTGGFKGWLTGAPKIGETKEWKKSFEKDMQDLVTTVYTGSDDHKLKGGCDACTEEQIKVAIEYIKSQTK